MNGKELEKFIVQYNIISGSDINKLEKKLQMSKLNKWWYICQYLTIHDNPNNCNWTKLKRSDNILGIK